MFFENEVISMSSPLAQIYVYSSPHHSNHQLGALHFLSEFYIYSIKIQTESKKVFIKCFEFNVTLKSWGSSSENHRTIRKEIRHFLVPFINNEILDNSFAALHIILLSLYGIGKTVYFYFFATVAYLKGFIGNLSVSFIKWFICKVLKKYLVFEKFCGKIFSCGIRIVHQKYFDSVFPHTE